MNRYTEDLQTFLSEVLDRALGKGYFMIINTYVFMYLGVGLAQAIMEKPKDTYKIMTNVWGNDESIKVIDAIILSFLNSIGLEVEEDSILASLKNGDMSTLLRVSRKYIELLV